MTAIQEPDVFEVTVTSRTTAHSGQYRFEAGTGHIKDPILDHARRRARRVGRPVRIVATFPNGREWTQVVEPAPAPEPQALPRHIPSADDPDDDVGSEGESSRIRDWKTGIRVRAAEHRPLGTSVARLSQRRGVRYTAVAGGLAAAVAVGAVAFGGGSDKPAMAPDRPLETFSMAGAGDRTSGPGVIEAAQYAYYVWPRTAAGVSGFWAPGAAGPPDVLQKDLDKAAADKLQFRLEVTATADPLIYDAQLKITTSDGVEHPYAQRYRLTRDAAGKYLIASKTGCKNADPCW